MYENYEADRARPDDLRPLTTDTDILLHRLIRTSREMPYRDTDGREGTLTPLLENHVLTVLADIRRKRLAGYGNTFTNALGTTEQARYARKLEQDVKRWTARLEAYLHTAFAKGFGESPAVQTAGELLDRLNGALRTSDSGDNRRYYRMLRTVTDLQKNADRYWQQAADSGDSEPALALLLAYLKNYASIAEAFNRRFASLPEVYRREILHVQPTEAVPDHVLLVVTPAGKGFTLKKGTAFAAGEDLAYRTVQDEYIGPMQCVQVLTTYQDENGLHLQTLHPEDAATTETLFSDGEVLRTGWLIESPMLVLEEGKREVEILFLLNRPQPERGTKQGFTVEYAAEEGWVDVEASCELSDHALVFRFALAKDDVSPTPCHTERHGTETTYPALRILTAPHVFPTWAEGLVFDWVRIAVEVSGIRNFTFLNELGETDTTQPFSPFGIQAEHGAWFLFGHRETGLKPLTEVTLTGTWQKLPDTRSAFDQLYKEYPGVSASSFRVKTACRKDGEWRTCAEGQTLFDFDGKGYLKPARFVFDLSPLGARRSHSSVGTYEYACNPNGFFRVSLDSPSIGFGMTAYRNRFTEVMVHNSRCKEKDRWALPQEPSLPLLAETEMGYRAVQEYSLRPDAAAVPQAGGMTPLAVAGHSVTPPREGLGRLLPDSPAPSQLYFALKGAEGEQRVRLYLEIALPHDLLPFYPPNPDCTVENVWQYWTGREWRTLSSPEVICDETAGLTQSGFVEIGFREGIRAEWLDAQGKLWLRAAPVSDELMQDEGVSSGLALRSVWTNCICVTADGGQGLSLPPGTIQATVAEEPRIGSIAQPLPGFGGMTAGTEAQSASHQRARFANRHRAVTRKDYEDILLEHFPEVEKVQCFHVPKKQGEKGGAEVCVVVFGRTEDSRYFLLPPWKLKEMERTLRLYAPACVKLRVRNPVYEKLTIRCMATLHFGVPDRDKVHSDLVFLSERFFMPWRKENCFPVPGLSFSARELYSRLVNHEDLQRVTSLVIQGKEYLDTEEAEDLIRGREPWSILWPDVEIVLSAPDEGVGGNGIGSDFVIG